MTGTKWIDAYLYNRYLAWNKSWKYKAEQKDPSYDYVCENDRTKKICVPFTSICNYTCYCVNKWEYYLCKNENGWTCNTSASNGYDACIDAYTWTIDLNDTNCSYSGALGTWNKAKYFLIR